MGKSQITRPDYFIISDILWKLYEFECNNDCLMNLRHDGDVHTNVLYLECSFINDKGKKERIKRYLGSQDMKLSFTDMRAVIDYELNELEMLINERRSIKTIKFSQLIARANKQDWLGRCMIVKDPDGSTNIRCHDTPTYYGDGIEPDPDEFWSLYCVIENDVITDTFRMNEKYQGYMETVYEEDNITVDYCDGWDYIEIFGLTDKEFNSLFEEGDGTGDYIKTFTFENPEMTKRKKQFEKSNKKAEIVDSYFYAIDELSKVSDELTKTKIELEEARKENSLLLIRLNEKENPYHEKYMNMTAYEVIDRINEINEAEMREIPFGELVYIGTYLAPKVKEMLENINSLEEVA